MDSRQLYSGRMYSSRGLAFISGSGSKVRCLALNDCEYASKLGLFVTRQSSTYGMNLTVVDKTCSFEPKDSATVFISSCFKFKEQFGEEATEVVEG